MRTISSAPAALQGTTEQSWSRWLVATLKRWWVAYMTWRIERAALPPTNAATGLRFALFLMQAACMIAMVIEHDRD